MIESELICVNLDEDWWIKIVNNFGMTDFINIKNNLHDVESISTIEDLFEHLILPPPTEDRYGNIITWEILDYENLYSLSELPEDYLNKSEDPACCFESIPESYHTLKYDTTKNYFDSTLTDFK